MKRLWFSLLFLPLFTACPGPSFDALNTPPPGKIAVVDDREDKIVLSKGVALALGCSAVCEDFEASTGDSNLLGVKPAHLDELVYFSAKGKQPRPGAVIYGLAVGRTKLFLKNDSAERELEVEIVE